MSKLSNMALMGVCHLTWKRYLQEGLNAHKITLKQSYLLRHLAAVDYLNPSDIADMLFCDRPTATVVISNMEKQGWVKREKDPGNLKRVRVLICKEGRAKLKELQKSKTTKPDFDPMEALSASERKELGRLLRKVREHLGTIKEP